MELSLGDLLDHKDLGLRLVTGPDDARSRPVRGAHSIEITPSRWVPRDWVMLTTGLRLRGRPSQQRRLVAELDAGGQAALGWAIGMVTRHVPKALVDEARRRSFPVFEVPLETAFHQVVSFLAQARAHDDVHVMQRVAAMEDHLLDALGAADPERETVRRLSSLLDAEVTFTPGAGPRVSAGAAPRAQRAQSFPVHTPGAGDGALVVRPAPAEQTSGPLVHRAVQLLELLARRDTRKVEAARRQGAALLGRCLTAASDPARSDAEAAALGVPVSGGAHAVVWSAAGPGASAAAHAFLDATGTPHLLTTAANRPVALVAVPSAGLVRSYESEDPSPAGTMGVGGEIGSLGDLHESVAGAHAALLTSGTGATVATTADLDPLTLLLVQAAARGTLTDLRAHADPLRDKPHLLETARCWLATDCDVNRTAAGLHVHRNSLRYRLTRIADLTGLPVTSPRGAANLRLALLADDLAVRMPSQ